MKIYLIVALFLAAFVVAHADDVELPEQDVELPEQPEQQDQPDEEVNDSTEKDEEDEEDTEDSPGTEEDDQESDDDDVEDEEDDPEKRRRRNILSSISCRRLKRRGHCRRSFIKRLCAATCYVPICRDKLSRTSCRRLRRTGKCGLSFVRRYCRKTCGNCPKPTPCRNYAVLYEANRRQSRSNGGVRCDRGGFVKRWYRFAGPAGTKMPTRAPPKNRCGTHAPGWMRGNYPRNGEVVSRTVCFHWGANKCNWNTKIKVKRCRRGRSYYYVFKLGPTPACSLRYCGNR